MTIPSTKLAGPFQRLAAVFIDGLTAIPAFILFGIGSSMESGAVVGLGALVGVGIFVYQLMMLTKEGQTVGKKMMKIKIVLFKTGKNGGFVPNVLMRSLVNGFICSIPLAGGVYALVDLLFIFREDHRCIHDLIGGTSVVKE